MFGHMYVRAASPPISGTCPLARSITSSAVKVGLASKLSKGCESSAVESTAWVLFNTAFTLARNATGWEIAVVGGKGKREGGRVEQKRSKEVGGREEPVNTITTTPVIIHTYRHFLARLSEQLSILLQSDALRNRLQSPTHWHLLWSRYECRGHLFRQIQRHLESWMNGGLHLFGHTHLQVLKLRTFGWGQTMFLRHLHWQLDGSSVKGGLHLILGHSQSQVLLLNFRGGMHHSGLHLRLHLQLNSSLMHRVLTPIGIHMNLPQQLNRL